MSGIKDNRIKITICLEPEMNAYVRLMSEILLEDVSDFINCILKRNIDWRYARIKHYLREANLLKEDNEGEEINDSMMLHKKYKSKAAIEQEEFFKAVKGKSIEEAIEIMHEIQKKRKGEL